jgi:hypothetical protein
MPTYDYFCAANDRTVEVQHGMSERLATWGELCERAGIAPGRTPRNAPVERLATGGNVIGASSLGSGTAPAACDAGPACCGGGCPALN